MATVALAAVTPEGEPVLEEEDRVVQARTIDATPEIVAAGQEEYLVCSGCHGEDGEGVEGLAPTLQSRSFLGAASDEFLHRTISEGRGGTLMPAFGEDLTSEQIDSLVAYIRTFNPTAPIELDERPLVGDAERGAESFGAICYTCHGERGEGYGHYGSGTAIGRSSFLDVASDGYLREIILNGKSGTAMRPFARGAATAIANLDDQEVEDVITWLRANAWEDERPAGRNGRTAVEHGQARFEELRCARCHGVEGRGNIPNPNYIDGSSPELQGLADRLFLWEQEDANWVIEQLSEHTDFSTITDAPFRSFGRFAAQIDSTRNVIRNGNPAGLADPEGEQPWAMPAWRVALSDEDVDDVLAYLISTFNWEE